MRRIDIKDKKCFRQIVGLSDSQSVSNFVSRVLLIAICLCSCYVVKAYDFEVDGLCYNFIASDQVEVTYKNSGGGGYSGSLKIPESVIYNDIVYSVTKIGANAFAWCSLRGSLMIPNSVTSIGEFAFYECWGLSGDLTIPNSVISIGESAFKDCWGFKGELTLSNALESIENCVFWGCDFSGSLTIPNSVTSIGDMAFYNCYYFTGSLIIPNSVTSIGETAFYSCYGFTDLTIPNSLTTIEDYAFWDCTGFTGSLTIPNSLSHIGDGAFCNCRGFTGSLTIPNSVSYIGEGAFSDCSGLTSINVEKGNPIYDSRDNCNAIIETESNTLITGCANTTIPNDVNNIGGRSFKGCYNLKSIIIPNNITSIGDYAFYGCSGLASITIPNSITIISKYAFSGCRGLTSITIPNSVTSIKDAAFYSCSGLKDITIPNSVTFIGSGAFGWCDDLDQVYSNITVPYDVDSFVEISSNASLHIPKGTKSLYQQYQGWTKPFANIIEDIDNPNPPVTMYTLSIRAKGNGIATYNGETIRETTKTYTLEEGSKVSMTFTPDNGYRIKSLKVNGSTKTASTSYTVTVNADTSVEVEFEAIPATTYTLTIKATGNGSASYDGTTIRGATKTFTVNEGTSATITFTPDDGYRIKSLKVNGSSKTASTNYTVTVNADTSVEVEFEEIPVTSYTLTITAIGNGYASYNGENIRNNTSTYTLNEGATGTITFTPDEGYHIKSLMVNGSVISIDTSYSFTMNSDTSVEVEFEETVVISKFSVDGLNYEVNSLEDHTVTLGAGDYGLVLEVPEKVTYNDEEWTVIGIANDALASSEELAAVIWHLGTAFNAKVTNPNLLLYVKDEAYAPVNIKNVVVNNYASSISLTEAMSGNNFYCPQAFTAQSIEYTHNYLMKTGLNESRGWETIALPFDVQKISHSSKGEIIPFAKWTSDGSAKPFWLYELSGSGFVEAEAIKANTPYIISMPNNEAYPGEYQLTGRVTFLAENVEVKKSDEVQTATFSSNTFVPNFICRNDNEGCYALNVSNDYEYYRGAENEGSKFILNLRKLHPFEAYMTSTSGTRSIDIFDSMTTGIRGIEEIVASQGAVKVYDLSGRLIKMGSSIETIRQELPTGVYIINNKKMIIK